MKRGILFNLLLGLLVVNVKADYREDYQNAYKQLNEKLIKDETSIKPKTEIKTVVHFFYDVILYVYAKNTQNNILRQNCYKYLKSINDEKLIKKLANAIEEVYGQKGNSKHLSLYALRNQKNELILIFRLFKRLSKSFADDTVISLYKNYQQDLWLDSYI